MSPARSRYAQTFWRGQHWVDLHCPMPPSMCFDLHHVAEQSGAWSAQDWMRRALAEAMVAGGISEELSPFLISPNPDRWRHDGFLTDLARARLDEIRLDTPGIWER